MSYRRNLAISIRQMRKHLGVTRKQFSEVIREKEEVIKEMEGVDGTIKVQTLIHISKRYGISIDYLLGFRFEPQIRLDGCKWTEPLIEERKRLRKTIPEMADEVKIPAIMYHRYEEGKVMPSVDSYIKMAKIFDVSLDYIMGLTDHRTKLEQIDNFIEKIYQHFIREIYKEEVILETTLSNNKKKLISIYLLNIASPFLHPMLNVDYLVSTIFKNENKEHSINILLRNMSYEGKIQLRQIEEAYLSDIDLAVHCWIDYIKWRVNGATRILVYEEYIRCPESIFGKIIRYLVSQMNGSV